MRWVCLRYCRIESDVEDYELATRLACKDDWRDNCFDMACCDVCVTERSKEELTLLEEFGLVHFEDYLLGGVLAFVSDGYVYRVVQMRRGSDVVSLLPVVKSFLLKGVLRGAGNEVRESEVH